jgi:hypothetical protein
MASDQKPDLKGWQPLKGPRVGREAFQVTPFMRLARVHAAVKGANILVGLALIDSVFFVDPEEARGRVALALLMTMVPFTLLAPMIGPWLDRLKGGRRFVIVGACALPIVMSLLMIRELETLLLYPLAFLVLMLDKSYNVAKSAVVPSLVQSDEELVQANAMLTRLGILAPLVAGPIGGLARFIGESVGGFTGGQAVLAVAAIGFGAATALSLQLPKVQVASEPTSKDEKSELRGGAILLAASAMALVRGIAGFVFLLMAFRYQEDPFVLVVLVGGATGVGNFGGTFLATGLRKAGVAEERLLQMVMGLLLGVAVVATYLDGSAAAGLLALAVALAGTAGKLAFDSIVQKDAPDSNRGRAFARFETRFQLVWVAGSFVPVLLTVPLWAGYVVMGGVAAFALVSYLTGVKAVAAGKPPPQRTKDFQRRLVAKARNRRPADATTTVPEPAPGPDPTEVDPTEVDRTEVDRTEVDPTEVEVDHRPPPPQPDTTVVIDPTKL